MKREDHILVQRVVEGDVTRKEFDAFQQRLRGESTLLEAYRAYALLEHTLCEEFEGMPLRRTNTIAPMANSWAIAGSFAAAAALVLLAVVVWKKPAAAPALVTAPSTVEFSEDAIWDLKGGMGKIDDSWAIRDGGGLELKQGRAKITLAGGGLALIDGPADLRVTSGDAIFLHQGRGYFRLEKDDGALEVETPSLLAVDLGTAFGVSADRDRPDELHVFEGKVRLQVGGQTVGEDLIAGDGARVDRASRVERFEVIDNAFPVGLGGFKTVLGGHLEAEDWRIEKGNAEVKYGIMSGTDFEAFRKVPELAEISSGSVVIATLETLEPAEGHFHSGNWAGMSFLKNGREILFFGDSYGDGGTWSLDLKQGAPVVLPDAPVSGAQKVTMRYVVRTGQVTLHQGGLPLAEPFCRGWMEPGRTFDEVRIGAAYGAAIVVKNAEVRIK